jgi:hypothetical protein
MNNPLPNFYHGKGQKSKEIKHLTLYPTGRGGLDFGVKVIRVFVLGFHLTSVNI